MTEKTTQDEPTSDPKAELEAMKTVLEAVQGLSPQATGRVLAWVSDSLKLEVTTTRPLSSRIPSPAIPTETAVPRNETTKTAMGYEDIASFVDGSGATTGSARAVAAAYWKQVVEGEDSWTGAALNTELKHQGHKLANVTSTLNGLMKRRPSLVVQVKKGGTSKQARKLYMLTSAGIKEAKAMFSREAAE